MGRLVGKREWETCYHGWDLVDVMKDQGFVRPDGKTLIPQPHVLFDDKYMWTLDHLKGIEFEVNEDETVLNAAFRQGISLTHGCREGQCSACKSFLLDGDIEMEKYSTFALPEYESDEGYVLLCRCHAYSDLEVELINYDEDIIRLGIPIESYRTIVEEIEPLTHDIKRLVLKIAEPGRKMRFNAGQYSSLHVPGSEEHRAYSMANTPRTNDRLEFIIKVFPGGLFSGLLAWGITIGQELAAD